jgi:hypothetical protein
MGIPPNNPPAPPLQANQLDAIRSLGSPPDMSHLRDIPRYPTIPPEYYTREQTPAWLKFLKDHPYLVPVVLVFALGLALGIIGLALGLVGGAFIVVAHIVLGLILVLCHVLAAIAILIFNSSNRPGR